jgi:hypothetical protein
VTAPKDVATFHAEFDHHPNDRIALFGALAGFVLRSASVLYPGSFVDIAPSVWFDDVTYVDMDKRCPRFFAESQAVADLITAKRVDAGVDDVASNVRFVHADYRDLLPLDDASFDLVVSMYAGFISVATARYLRPGGVLVTNNSHGDASMASLDAAWKLTGVITRRDGDYRRRTDDLDRYLVPKRGTPPTVDELIKTNRGIEYTTAPVAYVFTRE